MGKRPLTAHQPSRSDKVSSRPKAARRNADISATHSKPNHEHYPGNLMMRNIAQEKSTNHRAHLAAGNIQQRQNLYSSRHGAGLPPAMQARFEHLSGVDLADVRVHRNSSEPARMQAHAMTRGADIYLGAGKDGYLAHELWHAVQQKQGRVQANTSFKGAPVSSAPGLEAEAESMSARAGSMPLSANLQANMHSTTRLSASGQITQLAPNQQGTTDPQYLLDFVRRLEGEGLSRSEILDRISSDHASNANRYIYTDDHGWVDLRHFGAAGGYAMSTGSVVAEALGLGNEVVQWLSEWGDDYRSGFSPEDIPSNAAGAAFGDDYVSDDEPLSVSLERWLKDVGARKQDDPVADKSSLPVNDPAARGGANRGSSNASRTQSTASDNEPVNEFMKEWESGWRALDTPEGWYRLFDL